ncbi:MAG TPA: hypothetical protein VMG10_13830 [Gemmataceae bacterium]|nr:hypothetical protein [Gemmataceae bacterium]
MKVVPWSCVALTIGGFLSASSLQAQLTLDPRTYKDIEAELTVQVADRTAERGFGAATFTLTVKGPDTLEVEEPRLDDPAGAWKEERPPSTKVVHDSRATWRQVFRLKQSKKGIETLPDVSVRFRDGPGAEWEEATWVDILKHIRSLQAPPATAEEPLSWLRRWGLLLALAASALLVLLIWLRQRRRLQSGASLPPDQWALREIERIETTLMPPQGEAETYHTQMSYVVRRYLTDLFGLHALQQTTAELLEAVHWIPQATDEHQTLSQKGTEQGPAANWRPKLTAEQLSLVSELFKRCDLAKFARASTSPDECRNAAELARELVRQTRP